MANAPRRLLPQYGVRTRFFGSKSWLMERVGTGWREIKDFGEEQHGIERYFIGGWLGVGDT